MPIQSIAHKGLRRLYEDDDARAVPANTADKLTKMLVAIDTAQKIDDIAVMLGWKLHPLTGDLAEFWSLTVTRNWLLVFRFENGDASDLDMLDYH
jgi:toxin HigB-1